MSTQQHIQFITRKASRTCLTILIAACCGAALAPAQVQAQAQAQAKAKQYQVSNLDTLGGNNGFATGANNLRQAVGWAENDIHDPTCVSPQVLQFRPAMWTLGPPDQIQDLPLIPGDTSGAATAINDNGQIVGISGICDQAIGRHTAKHAVARDNSGM